MGARGAVGRRLPFACTLLLLVFAGCRGSRTGEEQTSVSPPPASRPPIADVLKAHTPALMAIPGVTGTAEGERHGAPVVLVLVEKRSPALLRKLPKSLDGYPVEVRETGIIRPLGNH